MSIPVERETIQPIAIIHSCYVEKFGIPRQPGLVDKVLTYIKMIPPFNRIEMFRELDQFSHIWILFRFHESDKEGWKTTVRPPGLGGQRRVGVFASRSPHRPNHIGISVVKLIAIKAVKGNVQLVVEGGDFLDGTPVLDIKPYVPFCDDIREAKGGYAFQGTSGVVIQLTEEAKNFCVDYHQLTGRDLEGLLTQVLAQDPRPASQRHRAKSFGIQLWDVNIRWRCEKDAFLVTRCEYV